MDSNYRFRARMGTLLSARTLPIYLKLFVFCRMEPFVEGAEASNPSPSGEESANFQSLSIMRSTRATTCSGDPPRGHSTSA